MSHKPQSLKELRKLKGYSLTPLALKLRVSPLTIMAWESGKRSPYFGNLERLAEALEFPVEELQKLFAAQH